MPNGSQEAGTTVVVPPQTTLQLGAQSLSHVTAALGGQPLMLVVVLLNLVFIGTAGYFMLQLERYRAGNLTALIDLMRSCVLETAPLASAEAKRQIDLEAMIKQNQQIIDANKDEIEHLRQEQKGRSNAEQPVPPYVSGGKN